MMLFIEHTDGTSVDGIIVGKIREFARLIWVGLYDQKMAPEKWDNVSKKVKDQRCILS
jgi:hypothetical protein